MQWQCGGLNHIESLQEIGGCPVYCTIAQVQ
jgi:hypothetical protein